MEDDIKSLITQEGYDKLEKELEYLKTTKRKEISERLRVAIGFGDLSENSEYDEAKNEQAKLEEQIAKLEERLKYSEIVNEDDLDISIVNIGTTVKVMDVADGEEYEYTIVSTSEIEPFSGKISTESPVGKVLLGSCKNDIVTASTPSGEIELRILDIYKSK